MKYNLINTIQFNPLGRISQNFGKTKNVRKQDTFWQKIVFGNIFCLGLLVVVILSEPKGKQRRKDRVTEM